MYVCPYNHDVQTFLTLEVNLISIFIQTILVYAKTSELFRLP